MQRGISWRHFDFWLLGAVIMAIAFGVAMIRSAVAGNAEILLSVNRQIQWAAIGLAVIVLVASIDYHYWSALYLPMYVVMLILLMIVSVVAQARFGAARWLEVGTILVQPTELSKIVSIIILARYFDRSQKKPRDLRWILYSFLWILPPVVFILLQPNLSNVIVTLVIWGSMLWATGIQLKHLAAFAGLGLLAAIIAFPFLQPYQQARVITFLFPDPNASYGETYNVQQALIAIGSGGLLGQGYGHGTQVQLRFLKVRHTDFIFSAIAEEFGLIGSLFVIVLLAFIVYRCLRAARLARDLFGSMIAYGVAVLIFFQGAVNIAVNLNLIPVTGLPLPFISYGGSGLLSLMLGIGLVESVVLRQKIMEF